MYHSNPFAANLHGLARTFSQNPIPSILLGLWMLLGGISLLFLSLMIPESIVTIIGLLITILWFTVWWAAHIFLVNGSFEDKKASTGAFLSQGVRALPKLVVLNVLILLIVLLGLAVLIIPGLLFLAWFSLAPYAMMAENLGPIAALKRSYQLAKGHVFEIYGVLFASNVLASQGLLSIIVLAAGLGARYNEIKALKTSNAPKPRTHWLNFAAPVLILLIIAAFVALMFTVAQPQKANPYQSQYEYEYEPR